MDQQAVFATPEPEPDSSDQEYRADERGRNLQRLASHPDFTPRMERKDSETKDNAFSSTG